jgi:Ca2+-binding RTX toxin-like protein
LGSQYSDSLSGDEFDNSFEGGPGDDRIDGRGGDDFATYILANGGVVANLTGGTAFGAGAGSDTLQNIENLTGSNFGDILVGNRDPNLLVGLAGDDELWGRRGFDTFEGGPGSDRLFGGQGILDLADYSDASGPVQADLAAGTAVTGGEQDSLSGIEGLQGSAFSDQLRGDAGDNFFIGGDGDDQIDGGDGNAAVDADPARDTVWYFSSVMPGGITFDTGPVRVDLTHGTAWNSSDKNQTNGDTLTGIEDVAGSPKSDVLIGDASDNLLMGDSGNDRLEGRGGADAFNGDAGNDRMFGGAGGNDFVYYMFGPPIRANLARGRIDVSSGNARRSYTEHDHVHGMEILAGSRRNDVMRGGPGPDFMLGQGGRDRLYGRGGNDALKGGRGKDFILDGGPGRDHCTDPRRHSCEFRSLPDYLLAQLRHLAAELKSDTHRHHARLQLK